MNENLVGKKYDILLVDPPWHHYGSPNKNAAAGKHYSLMSDLSVQNLPIKSLLKKKAFVFVWATGPRLNAAISAIQSWDLYYRGVGHVWVKTRKDGGIIHGQGVPPTYSKPTTEFLLTATTTKGGRPVKLLSSKLPQVVLSPREGHSVKPEVFREHIDSAFRPGLDKIELFARKRVLGWDAIGSDVCAGEDIRTSIDKILGVSCAGGS